MAGTPSRQIAVLGSSWSLNHGFQSVGVAYGILEFSLLLVEAAGFQAGGFELLPGEAMHRLTDEPLASNEASSMGFVGSGYLAAAANLLQTAYQKPKPIKIHSSLRCSPP